MKVAAPLQSSGCPSCSQGIPRLSQALVPASVQIVNARRCVALTFFFDDSLRHACSCSRSPRHLSRPKRLRNKIGTARRLLSFLSAGAFKGAESVCHSREGGSRYGAKLPAATLSGRVVFTGDTRVSAAPLESIHCDTRLLVLDSRKVVLVLTEKARATPACAEWSRG